MVGGVQKFGEADGALANVLRHAISREKGGAERQRKIVVVGVVIVGGWIRLNAEVTHVV